jgi:NADH:ubiquinone reductase (non-electrogenic)
MLTNPSGRSTTEIHSSHPKKTVCVVGGGFGGLYTALQISKQLDKEDEIYLIDKKDSFVFLPLLYELSVGNAAATEVAPKYSTLLNNTSIKFLRGEATEVRFEDKSVSMKAFQSEEVTTLKYDQLVISVGIQPRLDIIPGAKEYCLPFYRLQDADSLKKKLSHLQKDGSRNSIKVAVIGGGYSGVEVATTIAQTIGRDKASVTLIDRNGKIMSPSTEHNRGTAERALQSYGITTKLKTSVKEVRENELILIDGNGREYSEPADLIILTSGTQQSEFIKSLNIAKDATGRILTGTTLQSKDYNEVFALGDCSCIEGQLNPSTAQVAMQQSDIVAKNLGTLVKEGSANGTGKLETFKFLDLGEMVTLGITDASVTSLGGLLELSGPFAALGRRIIYAVRMPTTAQKAKALITASSVTAGKLMKSFFLSRME